MCFCFHFSAFLLSWQELRNLFFLAFIESVKGLYSAFPITQADSDILHLVASQELGNWVFNIKQWSLFKLAFYVEGWLSFCRPRKSSKHFQLHFRSPKQIQKFFHIDEWIIMVNWERFLVEARYQKKSLKAASTLEYPPHWFSRYYIMISWYLTYRGRCHVTIFDHVRKFMVQCFTITKKAIWKREISYMDGHLHR